MQHIVGKLYLKAAGVNFGQGVRLFGLPIISVYPKSQIVIGDRVLLRSSSRGNAIGVNHQVVLRTQSEGALIQIGNRVGMSGGAICARRRVIIADDVLIGANVVIADNDFHAITHEARIAGENDIVAKEIVIERGVWIGADVYICKGVTIGENSVIGAKSVVTKSLPANCIAVGIPAKVVREISF
ncbi:MAG: hypothetical protein A2505_02035 [Deltaproteobacteria bacterium RIFOXYD12_FULL_55_16]|nr:MAG: hypothetical protein A2505_02035 [Deltaproteobacteria bacterium RIFOXYD12_FULL_55_16]